MDFRSSAWTAAVSNCPAPSPTKSDFRPPSARAVEIETAAQATPPCAFASSPRPSRPREEDQQPANVADGDVSRRDRIALGLADWAVGQQRARPPAANDQRPACGGPGHRRRRVRRIRILEGADRKRTAPVDPRWGECATAEELGLRQGKERPGLPVARSRGRANQPPLVLRLVVAQGGKHPVYLVTSVLDEATLSDKQVVEIYALRWGVELFDRHFKQTFERRKLRSRSADNAELEGTWSLLGLWAMSLHAQVELAARRCPGTTDQRGQSVAGVSEIAPRIQERCRPRGIVARTRVEGRDRPLQASEQVQPRLSSQETRPRDRRSRNS